MNPMFFKATVTAFMAALFAIVFTFDLKAQPLGESDPVKTGKEENLGWHYYWDPTLEEEEPLPEDPPVQQSSSSQASPSKIQPFSTQWFQQNFETIQQAAIDNPNRDNMRALLYVERVMADKGEVFARRKRFVQSTEPLLQEGTRIPMMGAAKNALMLYKDEQKEKALQELANHVGLAFFYDSSCQWCHKMIPVVNYLKEKTDLNIRVFAKNSATDYIPILRQDIPVYPDNGYSKQFQITVWPALVMLRPPLDVYVIAQGNVSYPELTTRAINVAFDQNVLSEEWYYRVYPEQEGLISPEQLQNTDFLSADDPLEMIKQVMKMIEHPEGIYPASSQGTTE